MISRVGMGGLSDGLCMHTDTAFTLCKAEEDQAKSINQSCMHLWEV